MEKILTNRHINRNIFVRITYLYVNQTQPIFSTLRYFFNEYINSPQFMLVYFICQSSGPVQ